MWKMLLILRGMIIKDKIFDENCRKIEIQLVLKQTISGALGRVDLASALCPSTFESVINRKSDARIIPDATIKFQPRKLKSRLN